MQLQVDISRQTCLIIQKSVKKVVFFSGFWRFSTTPEFSPYDVTHYKKYIYFWFGWSQNRTRILKMYNIMGIWPIDQELLSCKPIATLRWNEMKQEAWRRPRISDHWLTDWLSIYLSIDLSIYIYAVRTHLSIYLSGGRNCRTLHWLLSGNI